MWNPEGLNAVLRRARAVLARAATPCWSQRPKVLGALLLRFVPGLQFPDVGLCPLDERFRHGAFEGLDIPRITSERDLHALPPLRYRGQAEGERVEETVRWVPLL